jgi:CubicO group peptidase (beta-lactamase class C family)
MKRLFNILKWVGLIIIIFEVSLFISGNSYVNDVLKDTVFKGRLGPSIENYKEFPYREVEAGNHQPWNESSKNNTFSFSDKQNNYFEEQQSTAFLVIHKDSIVSENYWDGFDANSATNSFSAAKTIVSILIGIAIEEGKLVSVNQKLSEFFPEYSEGVGGEITLKDLLTMSSGIAFDEDYINPFSFPAKSYYGYDIKTLTKRYNPELEPGKTWKYKGGDTQLLAFVLEKVTGMKIGDYASKELWNPIGAKNSAYWSTDVDGGDEKASCCFNSNARDFARIGKLYLNNGIWDGEQIVNKQFVKASISPANYLKDGEGRLINDYGYQWWLMKHNGRDVFYARGILGQYVIVVPEKELIVVRLGHKRERVPGDIYPTDAQKYLDFALEML